MIGGTDICIPTRAGLNALDLCVRIICDEWPEAVFEDANSDASWQSYDNLPLGKLSELFVYCNQASAQRWEAFGADPGLANTMIHLLQSKSTVTLVVDDADQIDMRNLVDLIQSSLQQDIIAIPAQREKAA